MAVDPFRYLGAVNPPIRDITIRLYDMTQRSTVMRCMWVGSGFRHNSKEHITRRAVDFMFSSKVNAWPTVEQARAGDAFCDYLIANVDKLKFVWIVWKNRSWSRERRTWKNLNKTGDISTRHYDHVHVLFSTESRWPTNIVDTASVSVEKLRSARYSDPSKPGRPVGPYGQQVLTLERALAKLGYLDSRYVDGHYGSQTVGNGVRGTTGFQRRYSGASKPDGWLGPRELAKLFELAGMSVTVRP